MKKITLLAALLVASAALAVQQLDLNISKFLQVNTKGIVLAPQSLLGTDTLIDAHAMTRSLGGSATIDFASVTITCEDSSAITVTGARTGDACFVGAPTTISGAGTGLHSTFSCYVSATNAVKVRHCAAGTLDNPASATFKVRVISSQSN